MELLDLIVHFIVIPFIVLIVFVIIPEILFGDKSKRRPESEKTTMFKYKILRDLNMDNYINKTEKYAKIKYKEVVKVIPCCNHCKYLRIGLTNTCQLSSLKIDGDLTSNSCECFCRK